MPILSRGLCSYSRYIVIFTIIIVINRASTRGSHDSSTGLLRGPVIPCKSLESSTTHSEEHSSSLASSHRRMSKTINHQNVHGPWSCGVTFSWRLTHLHISLHHFDMTVLIPGTLGSISSNATSTLNILPSRLMSLAPTTPAAIDGPVAGMMSS